jgi:5'-nucleotidase
MDGVLADWHGGFLKAFKKLTPFLETVPYEQMHTFDLTETYPPSVKQDVYNATSMPGLYRNLEPLPGAIEALKDMEANCQDFLEPFIVSAPNTHCKDSGCWTEKAQWVREHLGPWWEDRLILTRDKTVFRGHFLIDDKPGITGVSTPTWTQLLYPHPWNLKYRQELVSKAVASGKDPAVLPFSWKDWDHLKLTLSPGLPSAPSLTSPEKSRIILVS